MLRIVVLNPKGGSGKSTIAINLASYFANQGKQTSLFDCDPQGSSNYWLTQRHCKLPVIDSLSDTPSYTRGTKSWLTAPRRGTDVQVVDTPARPDLIAMGDLLRKADKILVPVLPSELDMNVAASFVTELLRTLRLSQPGERIAACANRVKPNTAIANRLNSFLSSLPIPHITTFRDSQNYIKASASGMGIFELDKRNTRIDVGNWQPLIDWIQAAPAPAMVQLNGTAAHSYNSPLNDLQLYGQVAL